MEKDLMKKESSEKGQSDTVCLYCGGDKVIPQAVIEDTGEGSGGRLKTLVAYKHPDALLFVGPVRAELRANICCSCGRVDLVVEDPERLWEDYQSVPEQERP